MEFNDRITTVSFDDGRTVAGASEKSRYRFRNVIIVALFLGIFSAFGTSVQNYVEITMRTDEAVSFFRITRWPLVWWMAWVVITPVFFELAWQNPVSRDNWVRPTANLILGNIVAFAMHVGLQVWSMQLPWYNDVHPTLRDAFQYHTAISLYLNVFIYWTIVGCAFAIRAYVAAQNRALDAARLETELVNARLDALRMQLHPHFLFNTLHGISTLMYRDVASADNMISRLSRLLRRALDRSGDHAISLREEIDFLNEYLAIERIRFADSVTVNFDIDPELLESRVPSFIFQPLVENALKHGISAHENQGTITVSAARDYDDETIKLSVEDDGGGYDSRNTGGSGLGLRNLEARLNRLYGDAYNIQLQSPARFGFIVTVTIPDTRATESGHNSNRLIGVS